VETDRLSLRSVTEADLANFHALHSDPTLYEHAPEAMHPDLDHSRSVIAGYVADWQQHGLGYWSVRRRTDNHYIGCGGVRRNEVNWNVYYRFRTAAWGNGYAVELIRTAAQCAEQVEPGGTLHAVIRPWNPASQAVARRLGMAYCGIQLDHAGVEELVYQLPAAALC
jgi:RimJ/RimL family protein N-acetyltransferase